MNSLAKQLVDEAADQDRATNEGMPEKDPAAVAQGGKARAEKLSPELRDRQTQASVTTQASKPSLPRWLEVYKRSWIWLAVAAAIGEFVLAARSEGKFPVIFFSAIGGSILTLVCSAIVYRLFVKPRLQRFLSPPSN